MDNSIIIDVLETFALALYAFPAIILGTWLATKSWTLYSIAIAGFAWIAFVISGPVYELWLNPEIGMALKVVAWTIPPIFFIVLNVGAIASVQAIRRGR